VVFQGQFTLLLELFDPKQPYYLRYSAVTPAVETAPLRGSNTSHNVPAVDLQHMTFVNDLDVGCCFDYCHEGVWEVAIIERLSELRDRFEISLPESKLSVR
jgi:hypothetical protein